MTKTKQLIFTTICVAIAIILPLAVHSIPKGGNIFLPMHIPVLFCGLICGPLFGFACGMMAPLLSGLITGMPPAPVLPGMVFELAVYGIVSGLLFKFIHTKNDVADVYIALIISMLVGRVISGILNALIFNVGSYSMQIWIAASFITALPGIIIQLVFIPVLYATLKKAKYVVR